MPFLKKNMQFRDLLILGLLFIGPTAPVGLFGLLDAKTDGAVALVYVVATIIMSFTALSYARMSFAIPNAGSVYAYCRNAISPKAGFLVGWLLLLDYLFIPAVAFLFSGISLNSLFSTIPVWIWTILAVFITTTLNLIGAKKSSKITLIILIAEVIVLALVIFFAVIELLNNGAQRPLLSPLVGGNLFAWNHLFSAVSLAVLSYLGFDAIATFAEESKGKEVSKAIIICLFLAGGLFIVQTYLVALISPYSSEYLRNNPDLQGKAFYDVVNQQLPEEIGWALAVMKAVGAAFAAVVGQAAAARVVFSMARDRRLPHIFSNISARTGIPALSIIAVATFNTLLAGVAAINPSVGLGHLVSFVDVGALTAFIMLNVSVIIYFRIRLKRSGNKSFLLDIVLPGLGIMLLLPVLWHISNTAKIVGIIWLVIGIGSLIINRNKVLPSL